MAKEWIKNAASRIAETPVPGKADSDPDLHRIAIFKNAYDNFFKSRAGEMSRDIEEFNSLPETQDFRIATELVEGKLIATARQVRLLVELDTDAHVLNCTYSNPGRAKSRSYSMDWDGAALILKDGSSPVVNASESILTPFFAML